MQSKQQRQRHVPQRTCVGCRKIQPKRTLIRIVCGAQGIIINAPAKMGGRGAYLHNQKICWEQSMKGALAHALKTELSMDDYEALKSFAGTLPE